MSPWSWGKNDSGWINSNEDVPQSFISLLGTSPAPPQYSVQYWTSLYTLPAWSVFVCGEGFCVCSYEKQPVYLHSMLFASLTSRSLRSNNDNSLSVPRVKTNTGARAFHSVEQPPVVCPFSHFRYYLLRNIWRYISLTWPFPHRYRRVPWPVDVTEPFPRFCCWTLTWLSRHWAWLRRGYWPYRSLIDWLICLFVCF